MTRRCYTATARRDGKWWLIQAPEVEAAFTQVKRLDQAEAMIREAIALLLDVPEDSFDVTMVPHLEGEAESLVKELDAARDEFIQAERRFSAATRLAAERLTDQYDLSLRDAGVVMHVSFQRVAQVKANTAAVRKGVEEAKAGKGVRHEPGHFSRLAAELDEDEELGRR